MIGLSSTVTRPVLRYHGGKFRLAPWVIKHFPPHRCYVEPFGGAAGVLVQKDRAYAEVYNDLDGDIVNVFRVLRDRAQCDELIAQLLLTPYARDEFDAAYEPTTDPIERARRTLVRAEMGFGSAGATKGTTGFRIDTRRKHGTAQALWARFPESLARVCERLAGVMIENRPALSIIDQHDAEDTLFYVDPPYVMGTLFYVDPPYVMGTRNVSARHGRYYTCEMSDDEHVQLLDKLCSVRGMVVLSGYESALYLGALQGWSMASTEARISAARGTGIRTECLWLNPAASRALERTGLFEQVAA